MKSNFHQYFRPDEEALKNLWEECLFVFDASVLLNVYGYSNQAAEELLTWLERIKARVRVPHQFGLEFAKNRPNVILKQARNYSEAEQLCEKLQMLFDMKREHPFLSTKAQRAFHIVRKELNKKRQDMDSLIRIDPYAERIMAVFDGRVGPTPSTVELQEMHAQAKKRYEKLIPPGYADVKQKAEPDCYSDYVGWRELIDIAKTEKRPVILVCDDLKDDWWRYEGQKDREIGPRPELIAEFAAETQQAIYIYHSDQFATTAKDFLSVPLSDTTIKEISERIESIMDSMSEMRRSKLIEKILPNDFTLDLKLTGPLGSCEVNDTAAKVDKANMKQTQPDTPKDK